VVPELLHLLGRAVVVLGERMLRAAQGFKVEFYRLVFKVLSWYGAARLVGRWVGQGAAWANKADAVRGRSPRPLTHLSPAPPLPSPAPRDAGHAPAPSVVDRHYLLGEGRGDDAPDVRQLGIPRRRKLRVCCVGWGAGQRQRRYAARQPNELPHSASRHIVDATPPTTHLDKHAWLKITQLNSQTKPENPAV
jgi:hypothetical protein